MHFKGIINKAKDRSSIDQIFDEILLHSFGHFEKTNALKQTKIVCKSFVLQRTHFVMGLTF